MESGVTERNPDDVSDIDVVWTDYRIHPATPRPVEAKSKAWKLEDLFKFFGWITYLKLKRGQLAYVELPEKFEKIERVAQRMGVELLRVDRENVDASFASLSLRDPAQPFLPNLWRFSYWARSRYFKSLQEAIRQNTCPQSAMRAKEYRLLVNDALFFESDPRDRLSMLLESHFSHQKLASTCAAEIERQEPDFDNPPADTTAFKDALYYGKHFPVQACFYLAHRARLYVIKAAVDTHLAHVAGDISESTITFRGTELNLGLEIPSPRFEKAIEHFAKHDWFPLLPTFWQVFLWGWGGFILQDRLEQERAELAEQTGIPEGAVEEALTAFERFFGEKFRLVKPRSDTRRVLPLMPAAMRGIGGVQRLWRDDRENYSSFAFPDSTAERMAQDQRAASRLLEGTAQELAGG